MISQTTTHNAQMLRYSVLIFLFFSGCALFYSETKVEKKKPLYEMSTSPLDEEFFHSPAFDIAGHFPAGWLQVNTESIPELENILCVYTDAQRAFALALTEIAGTAELRRNIGLNGMEALAQESFAIKSRKHPDLKMSRQPQIFMIDSMLFVNYEFVRTGKTEGRILNSRVVVFASGTKYYELAMVQLHETTDLERYSENFRLLQSVIAGLEGVATVKEGKFSR